LLGRYLKTKPELPWREPDGDDLAAIIYTGGTTGMPKGVMWRHIDWIDVVPTWITDARFMENVLDKVSNAPKELLESMAGNVPIPFLDSILDMQVVRRLLRNPLISTLGGRLIAELLPFLFVSSSTPAGLFTTNIPAYVLSPLMHGMGSATGELFSLAGTPIVLSTSESFDPVEVWETVEKRKVAIMSLVGDAFAKPMAEVLEREPGRYDLGSLLAVISVGHTFSPSVKKIFLKHIPGLLILDTLSATEAVSPAVQINTSADEEIEYRSFKADHTNVRVVDPETYKEVEPGEMGILMVGGNTTIPIGYFGDEKKTADVFKMIDGKRWNIFGDMCTVDKEGVIHFVGRGKLCVNTGGEKVYTEEVEDVIKETPKVETATVVGVPDERWGEAVSALVELKEGENATEEEIRESCRDKLAGYKIPKHVVFGKVPLTAIGKVSFKEAKKIVEDSLGIKG
jgi:fatty-acyl-CoA synthase